MGFLIYAMTKTRLDITYAVFTLGHFGNFFTNIFIFFI